MLRCQFSPYDACAKQSGGPLTEVVAVARCETTADAVLWFVFGYVIAGYIPVVSSDLDEI